MKDELFEPYYKNGFNHFIYKKIMHLKKPKSQTQGFYMGLIALILSFSILFG